MTAFSVDCRPEDSSADKLNVEDTDDEFIIKKPDSKAPAYDDFIKELYRHDEGKATKAKRSAEDVDGHEKLAVSSPEEFDIPSKPAGHTDGNYDQFLTHLYRHDELKRSRRMIVFRHEILRDSQSGD